MHDMMCEARDDDAGLACVLPEDHVGGHYDPDQGEWANGTDWCPEYRERHGRNHFCIYKRGHYGDHMNPVVGPWPQEDGENSALAAKAIREVVEWPLQREALKRARMRNRPFTKP